MNYYYYCVTKMKYVTILYTWLRYNEKYYYYLLGDFILHICACIKKHL